ncbi:MAG: tetraacyldisaccharide 4'-kinase [Betaproteobacteria bacterium]|nr:MAG: tetraacyldisaccharide 4'-kinase [Betaproteobacteria bacterium]
MGASFPEQHWYRLSALSLALWPASLAYRLLLALRRLAYGSGVLRAARLPLPVIVVGNIVAGGTGKTPLVLWLAAMLKKNGRKPGIISRGYRGSAAAPMEVAASSAADVVGDEPLLLARRGGCPVWIGAERVRAASGLLAAHPECDVLILDDGLQHYRLARDIEIAVEDARGIGNGFLLPAGPLREPASRRVDAWVANTAPCGKHQPCFRMDLRGDSFRRVAAAEASAPAAAFAGKRVHAVAGIGNPQRFFDHLARLGLVTVNHAFPDHHVYTARDLDFGDCEALLMTEKDAVKCAAFAREFWYALEVEAELAPAFSDFILAKLNGLKTARHPGVPDL